MTDYREILEKHFTIGKDIEVYYDFDDLRDKVNFYLENDDKRKEIAANLHRNVMENHTWDIRVRELLNSIETKIQP